MPSGWRTPSPGSWLARLLERSRRQDGEFDCAVRVVSGEIAGESGRWSYRRSAIDPLRAGDVFTLNHGVQPKRTLLRLRLQGEPRAADAHTRPEHLVWSALEVDTGAIVELAAAPGAFEA